MDRKIDLIAAELWSKKDDWEDSRTALETKWRKWYRTWKMLKDPADKQSKYERSQYKSPATKTAVNMGVDNLFHMLFGVDPFFDISGRQLSDMDKATLVKNYLEYLFGKERWAAKMHLFITSLCWMGTGIAMVKVEPQLETSVNKQPVMDPMLGIPIGEQLVASDTKIIRPVTDIVDIFDFVIEPTARNIAEAEGCFVKDRKSRQQLMKFQRAGIIDSVKDIPKASSSTIDENFDYKLSKQGLSSTNYNDIEFATYWGWIDENVLKDAGWKYEIEDGGAEVLAIITENTVLKCIPNPLITKERPFLIERYEEVPNEFYGIGVAEIAENSQDALDGTIRSRMDNKAISINQMFGINAQRLTPGQDITDFYPGKKILVEGNVSEIIQAFAVPDVTNGTYAECQELERYIQEGTGLNKMMGGFNAKKEQTATEASIVTGQGSVRLKVLAKRIEENVIKNALRLYYTIAIQFLNTEEQVRIQNDGSDLSSLLTINAYDMVGDYDFVPVGTSTMATKQVIDKLIMLLQQSANPYDIQLVDRGYLYRRIYEMSGQKDGMKVFKSLPPEQVMGSAMMMGGGKMGSPPAPMNTEANNPMATMGGGAVTG
ncbi:MAG: hypothetical protein NTX81_01370 [Candidatus Bathyarchaeota archaeon]|nr:hypothetical protein [Candidatus Bathyarchaeota archaeon]